MKPSPTATAPRLLLGTLLLGMWQAAAAQGVLIEAEAFASRGGWEIDTQFVDAMGSPYLLAHGMGVPVADAVTAVSLPHAGTWRLWVRTRDWTPDFADEKPGRFQIALNGVTLPAVFGTAPAAWGWADGGLFTTDATGLELRLKDLTGFDGRCDALYLAADTGAPAPPADGDALRVWRTHLLGEDTEPDSGGDYDLVVVGGGLAGTCAAIAAAERGLAVALIQDRPVLGGNTSGEIRVRSEGETRHRIVAAVANGYVNTDPRAHLADTNRLNEVAKYPSISLFTGWRAYGLTTNSLRHITAVDARQMGSGLRRRFSAPLFVDGTGDGWLGFWAGASFRMGREAASELNESRAPAVADAMTMGNSLMWRSADTGVPSTFPAVPWAMSVAGTAAETGGEWNWEYGMHLDTIYDAEKIRDHLFRAIYGNFYNAKQKPANANRALEWVPYVAGKRESRRIMGDYLLKQSDIVNGVYFEDAVGTATWHIDLHYPTDVSYRSTYTGTAVPRWYFPYRCLYSKDIPNLFMAGRNISVTHVGIGSPRVMNTCGQMGVAVGYAAALCKGHGCLPRDIYRSAARTTELQMLIGGAYPQRVILEPEPPEVVLILDNTGAEVAGSWVTSANMAGQFHGDNYLHDNNTGKGPDKWVRYTPDIPEDALYELRQMWSASSNRSTNVTVEVSHADGTDTVRVDMRQNGGVWNLLGKWRFAQGRAGSVRILTEGTSDGYVMADAFRVEKVASVIVDNPDAEVSGTWVGSVSMTGQFHGTNYLHSNKLASDALWLRYRPDLPEAGVYRLQQIWNGPSDRATAARVEVTHADGVTTNTVDMTQNVGTWRTVGFYRFAEGAAGAARLLTVGSSGKYVIADAFRWTPGDDVIIDNADPQGVTLSGTWLASSSEPGRYGANYLHNNKVSSPDTWVRFTPRLRSAGRYEVRLFWNGSNRATNVTVEVTHAAGTAAVTVDMSKNGGRWNALGNWLFDEGDAASVRVLTAGVGANTVIADAVWFAPYTRAASDDDWDGNGLPDAWERHHFLREGGVDPDADDDGDGLCNYGEYLAGTDPRDKSCTFSVRQMLDGGNAPEPRTLLLAWPSAEGHVYDILHTESLGQPFRVIASGLPAEPAQNTLLVPSEGGSGFYKVIVRPTPSP